MNKFSPFDNDTQSTTIGPDNGLTFENGLENIAIYGEFVVSKDSSPEELDSLINLLTEIKNNLTPSTKVDNKKKI